MIVATYTDSAPTMNGTTPDGWPRLDPLTRRGLAADVLELIEPHTEADPAALLFDFLASFGNAVGPAPHALADGSKHPARIFVVVVGDTSKARKGTSRANIARVFEHADPIWSTTRVLGGLASGEGLIAAVRDPGDDDTNVIDRRLLVVEPEFARVLAAAGRDSSTLSAIIRQAWDTGDLRVLTRKDPLVATGAHITVIGHITAEELYKRLPGVEVANGFANRNLFVAARRSKLLPSGGNLDDADLHQLGRRIRDRLEQSRKRGRIHRTPDAEERWAHIYAEIADDDTTGLTAALTARAEAQCLRLSLLYTLLDGAQAIDTPQLEAAYAAWRYAADSVRTLFADASGDTRADQLAAALDAAGPAGLDRKSQHAVFSNHATANELDLIKKTLIDQGRAEMRGAAPSVGRPREVLISSKFAGSLSSQPQETKPTTTHTGAGTDLI